MPTPNIPGNQNPPQLPPQTQPQPQQPQQQLQQPVQYAQQTLPPQQGQLPVQQQVVVDPGYTFGKFCLHACMFVGVCIVLLLGGCTLLMGGCAAALDDAVEDMSPEQRKEWERRMEARGHDPKMFSN